MPKILFLHGFFASGRCDMSIALSLAFKGRAEILAPDIPKDPTTAISFIQSVIEHSHPDVIIANSCGSFYAQILAPVTGIPALLGNPHFKMTDFLKERIGRHEYKSEREDRNQELIIDEALIESFARWEEVQFRYTNSYYRNRIWGIFGDNDTLASFEPLFKEHYQNTFHFPGGHTPTKEEILEYHVPILERLMAEYKPSAERYFRHFKGGLYRFLNSAYDSETKERMVVYQALYGEHDIWVRPQWMFFEDIEREGNTFSRFTEIDRPL